MESQVRSSLYPGIGVEIFHGLKGRFIIAGGMLTSKSLLNINCLPLLFKTRNSDRSNSTRAGPMYRHLEDSTNWKAICKREG